MNSIREQVIQNACQRVNRDKARMLDILWEVQNRLNCIDSDSMSLIAKLTGTYRVEVEGVVSFYSFFSEKTKGSVSIYLCDDIVDRHAGVEKLIQIGQEELGIKSGNTQKKGLFSLDTTPCIGMSDQAPAALINGIVFSSLTPNTWRQLLSKLKEHPHPQDLVEKAGEGNNAHPLINSMVNNNIYESGPILLTEDNPEAGLECALSMTRSEVLEQVESSGLKGRGGAGFSSARKWAIAASTAATRRYIVCNADEGEPGCLGCSGRTPGNHHQRSRRRRRPEASGRGCRSRL